MGLKNYSPYDYFYPAKKREVDAATRLMFEELARSYVYQPYIPASYGWSHLHMEIDNKMEDKVNKKFWMVVCAHNGAGYQGTHSTVNGGRRHDTEAAALREAEESAKAVPGTEYYVVQTISRSFVKKEPAITTRLG